MSARFEVESSCTVDSTNSSYFDSAAPRGDSANTCGLESDVCVTCSSGGSCVLHGAALAMGNYDVGAHTKDSTVYFV